MKIREQQFKPGQTVLVREIWQGRVWSAKPEIVVQDAPDLIALFIPPGIIWKCPFASDGKRISPKDYVKGNWKLMDTEWSGNTGTLRLTIPGAVYSVLVFWESDYLTQNAWYINLESPLMRTKRGFDYLDQFLDIIVEPDLKTWNWKDEDDFQEAQDLGLVSPQEAKMFRAEGLKALKLLQSRKSLFNSWERWKPEPSWKIPVLPEGWDVV